MRGRLVGQRVPPGNHQGVDGSRPSECREHGGVHRRHPDLGDQPLLAKRYQASESLVEATLEIVPLRVVEVGDVDPVDAEPLQ